MYQVVAAEYIRYWKLYVSGIES